MKLLIKTKQKVLDSVCNLCTKEDCPLFDKTEKNKRYYQACDREFMLNYSDTEEPTWCGECECRVSDFLCLRCANKRMDSLKLP